MLKIILVLCALLIALPAFAFEKSNLLIGAGVVHHNAKEVEGSDASVDDTQPMLYLGYEAQGGYMGMMWSRNNDAQKLFGVAEFSLLDMPLQLGTLAFNVGGGFVWRDWDDERMAAVVWGPVIATQIGVADVQLGYMRQTPGTGEVENLWHAGVFFHPGE